MPAPSTEPLTASTYSLLFCIMRMYACTRTHTCTHARTYLESAGRRNHDVWPACQLPRLLLHVNATNHHTVLEGHARTQSTELLRDLDGKLPAEVCMRMQVI